MADKIFIEGLYSQEVSDKAPEFILGKGSIHVKKLTEWLEKNSNLVSERGYINYTILESKSGSRYFEVDTWKPQKQEDTSKDTELIKELENAERMRQEANIQAEEDWKASGHEDIPF